MKDKKQVIVSEKPGCGKKAFEARPIKCGKRMPNHIWICDECGDKAFNSTK